MEVKVVASCEGRELKHHYINGVYKRVDVDKKGAPLFQHSDEKCKSIWIYEDNDHHWRIAHEMAKDSVLGGNAGYAKSNARFPLGQTSNWEQANKNNEEMPWDMIDWHEGVDEKWLPLKCVVTDETSSGGSAPEAAVPEETVHAGMLKFEELYNAGIALSCLAGPLSKKKNAVQRRKVRGLRQVLRPELFCVRERWFRSVHMRMRMSVRMAMSTHDIGGAGICSDFCTYLLECQQTSLLEYLHTCLYVSRGAANGGFGPFTTQAEVAGVRILCNKRLGACRRRTPRDT